MMGDSAGLQTSFVIFRFAIDMALSCTYSIDAESRKERERQITGFPEAELRFRPCCRSYRSLEF